MVSGFCPSLSCLPRGCGYDLPSCDLRSVTGTSGLPVTEGLRMVVVVVLGVVLGVAKASRPAPMPPDRRRGDVLLNLLLPSRRGDGGVRRGL